MAGEVEFTPTQEDWVRANRLWFKHPAGWLRWQRKLGFAMLGLGLMILLVDLLLLDKDVGDAVGNAAVVLLAAVTLLSLRLITGFFIPGQVRKQFKQRPAMADPVRYSWNDQGLRATTRTGSTDQRWSELYRQVRDGYSFVFLMTDQMMLMVPRRALSDAQAHDLAAVADRYGPAAG